MRLLLSSLSRHVAAGLFLWLPAVLSAESVAVPPQAREYRPAVVPPPGHPRVFVTPASLPEIRRRLTLGENLRAWETVKATALRPYAFDIRGEKPVRYDAPLLGAVRAKAFYRLVTGDKERAREAAVLLRQYLSRVDFGEAQDICREIGEAVFTSALLYDYCYGELSQGERRELVERTLELAGKMEIGWPPFREPAHYGHANEAQISRDLLAMGIACYDEFPDLYRYCAYCLMEVSAPVKNFTFASGRHDQGVSYGNYRFAWDLHAVLLFRRMGGYELLDPVSARSVLYRWIYLRAPDGSLFREGDEFLVGEYPGNQTGNLLGSGLYRDPLLKAEAFRIAPPEAADPVFLLLVNDPSLAADSGLRKKLPLTRFHPEPLGGMVARTGWNDGAASDDAVVTMNGAGYHYRNHHHLDAGAFQIYFRGHLLSDLGLYRGYGNSYDWNFNKSSVSHNTLLVRDPDRTSLCGPRFSANSGTQDVPGFVPADDLPAQLAGDEFRNGRVLAAGFGPDKQVPEWSFLMTDMTLSYRTRVRDCRRLQLFFNNGEKERPGTFIVYDTVNPVNPASEICFQLNSPLIPERNGSRLFYETAACGTVGKLAVSMMLPRNPVITTLTGEEVFRVDGKLYKPGFFNDFENAGSRTLVSGKGADGHRFLAVMQMHGALPEREVAFRSLPNGVMSVHVGDRMAVFPEDNAVLDGPFSLQVPEDGTRVLILNLAPGVWRFRGVEVGGEHMVESGSMSFFRVCDRGRYDFSPVGAHPTPPPVGNAILLNGKSVPGLDLGTDRPLVELEALLDGASIPCDRKNGVVSWRSRDTAWRADSGGLSAENLVLPLSVPVRKQGESLYVPLEEAAHAAGFEVVRDKTNGVWLLRPVSDPRWGRYLLLAGGGANRNEWYKLVLTGRQRWTFSGTARMTAVFRNPEHRDAVVFTPSVSVPRSIVLEVSENGKDFREVHAGVPPAPDKSGSIRIPLPPGECRALRLKLEAGAPGETCGIGSLLW